MCCGIREKTGVQTAALSGGVFQNRLLLRMCEAGLEDEGFEVLIHSMVPPNDGGICLGQAAVAARALYKSKENDPEGKGPETVERTVDQIDELHM
jgi:hydrogenase maturation protein HypF